MTDRRDRHGRGVRGPLSLPNPLTGAPMRLPGHVSAAEFFIQAITAAVQRLMQTCPDALVGVDIGVEDVPSSTFDWALLERVPLAAAIDATTTRPLISSFTRQFLVSDVSPRSRPACHLWRPTYYALNLLRNSTGKCSMAVSTGYGARPPRAQRLASFMVSPRSSKRARSSTVPPPA